MGEWATNFPGEGSAQDWGRRQAEAAPPWSDEKWKRVSAILRIKVAEPATGDKIDTDGGGERSG